MSATTAAGPVDASRSVAAVLKTLPARAVAIDGGLWARRQAVNRDAALPHGLRTLETAGNLDNFRIAAGRAQGRFRGRVFADSDVYTWLEAAALEMARVPSAALGPPESRPVLLTAIPYFAWANREPGAMRVWIPRLEESST